MDFPRVFEMLGARGFAGPYTLELETADDEPLTEAETLARVQTSVSYLRRIGVFE